MRILLVGAGGVGGRRSPRIAARRDFFEPIVVADYDAGARREKAGAPADDRFVAAQVDASDADVGRARCAASTASPT